MRWTLVTAVLIGLIVAPGRAAPGALLGYESQADQGAGGRMAVKLFFVALEDGGRSGRKIGCDDSIVAVERMIPRMDIPLVGAIAELVSIRETSYGQSGLYNALGRSHLMAQRVTVTDGVAEIRLDGALLLGGTCDAPRIEAQLRETALQFPAIKHVDVFINDVPLAQALSAK